MTQSSKPPAKLADVAKGVLALAAGAFALVAVLGFFFVGFSAFSTALAVAAAVGGLCVVGYGVIAVAQKLAGDSK